MHRKPENMNFRCCIVFYLGLFFVSCTNHHDPLNRSEQLMETAPDSALQILRDIHPQQIFRPSQKALYALLYSQALDKNEIMLESDSLISIATDYYDAREPERASYSWFYKARCANNRGDARMQAEALLKAQQFAEKTDNNKLRGLVYGDKANMYKTQLQTDSSIAYYKKAYKSFYLNGDKRNSIICLVNIGGNYLNASQYDSACAVFSKTEKLVKSTHDVLLYSTLYRNMGALYYRQENFKRALYYYNQVPLTHIAIYDSNLWFILANLYFRLGNADSTRFYLNKMKALNEMSPDYYRLRQTIAEAEGNTLQALNYAKRVNEATDSLYKRKLDISFAGLEKRYKYQNLQISNQQLIIRNNRSRTFMMVALLMVSTLIIILLLWRFSIKHKELETQKQLLAQEKELAEKEKERADKEAENNELFQKQLKLNEILLLNVEQYRKHSIKKPVNKIKEPTDPVHNNSFYQELIAYVDIQFKNISKRLAAGFPELTERDILICCLLLANFDTGMIASILDVKIESMNKQRFRLRAKLGLHNSEHLIDFLLHF